MTQNLFCVLLHMDTSFILHDVGRPTQSIRILTPPAQYFGNQWAARGKLLELLHEGMLTSDDALQGAVHVSMELIHI